MRILHLVPGLMTGGLETMLINIVNEQVKNHEVHVVIVNNDYDVKLLHLIDKNVIVHFLNRPCGSKNPYYLLMLNYVIWRIHPFVVHSHHEKFIQYLFPIGYKYVLTVHGLGISINDLNRHKNVVSISKTIKNDVEGKSYINSKVIYNGIKICNLKRRMTTPVYSKDNPFKIVQVSRMVHEIKGHDILINAVALLRDRGYDNICLDFIGDGDSRPFLENMVKECHLSNVKFLGTQTVNYINQHLCDYDLLVQPSRFEGFGLTVAEAMSAKVPVIVSDCNGPLEVVDYGTCGLTFKKNSVEDCANKIEDILNMDAGELKSQIEKALSFASNNFNIEVTSANYVEYYKECK